MNTTELFVEIIIIGTGTLSWIFLIILSIFGYNWVPWDKLTSVSSLLPIIALTYVLGIGFDRFSDFIFRRWANKLRKIHFEDKADYFLARIYIYTYASEQIISLFEYGKSRVRISRAWTINSLGIMISTISFCMTKFPKSEQMNLPIIISSSVFWGLVFASTLSAWINLVKNDYMNIENTYLFLKGEKGK